MNSRTIAELVLHLGRIASGEGLVERWTGSASTSSRGNL